MKQKLILSLLVGSMACGLTAKAKVAQPETAQEEIVATSRLAKLKNVTENSARKALKIARKVSKATGEGAFFFAGEGQKVYNNTITTKCGATLRKKAINASQNRELVGALVLSAGSVAGSVAGYKIYKKVRA